MCLKKELLLRLLKWNNGIRIKIKLGVNMYVLLAIPRISEKFKTKVFRGVLFVIVSKLICSNIGNRKNADNPIEMLIAIKI